MLGSVYGDVSEQIINGFFRRFSVLICVHVQMFCRVFSFFLFFLIFRELQFICFFSKAETADLEWESNSEIVILAINGICISASF